MSYNYLKPSARESLATIVDKLIKEKSNALYTCYNFRTFKEASKWVFALARSKDFGVCYGISKETGSVDINHILFENGSYITLAFKEELKDLDELYHDFQEWEDYINGLER